MAKMGRPVSNNPKNIRITVRLDKTENDILESMCKTTKQNKSVIIQNSIKYYYEYLKNNK